MQLIDCNTALGPVPGEAGSPVAGELLADMRHCGVSGALVRHRAYASRGPVEANRLACETGGEGLRPVLSLLPFATGENGTPEQVGAQAAEHGCGAFYLAPGGLGFSALGYACGEVYTLAAQLHVPVLLPFEETGADTLHQIATQYPQTHFIVLGYHYSKLRLLYPLLIACPNVYLESGMLKGFDALAALCRDLGASRLVFGSGWPVYDMGIAAGMLMCADISGEDKRRIAAGNLRNIWEGRV